MAALGIRAWFHELQAHLHQHGEVLLVTTWTAYFVFLLRLDSKKQQAHKLQMSPEKAFLGGTGAKVQVGEMHAYFKHLVNYSYFKANKMFKMV